jgi:hypothetical protein
MTKKIAAAAVLATMGLITVIGFQNCSSSAPTAGGVNAASSCKNQSILRNAYNQGATFSLPAGSTFTPAVCENRSAYNSLVFNSTNQTITLKGTSASKVFSLNTGGDACSGGLAVGGDRWKSASGEFLDTNLGPDELQVTLGLDIVCNVER